VTPQENAAGPVARLQARARQPWRARLLIALLIAAWLPTNCAKKAIPAAVARVAPDMPGRSRAGCGRP